MVQEYGRYFGMKTVLSARRLPDRPESQRRRAARLSELSGQVQPRTASTYTIFGYKGKQVRDNIHCFDVVALHRSLLRQPAPRRGLQHRRRPRQLLLDPRSVRPRRSADAARRCSYEYVDQNREGDHICYISDLSKMTAHYPSWDISKVLDDIFKEIVESWQHRPA